MTLCEAARAYNGLVDSCVETLRRRVASIVSLDCRFGPPTVPTSEEETCLSEYCFAMADKGFSLTGEV